MQIGQTNQNSKKYWTSAAMFKSSVAPLINGKSVGLPIIMLSEIICYLSDRTYDEVADNIPWGSEKDTLHLVVARYTTGSTFGRTQGRWAIEGAFESYLDAQKFANKNKKRFADKHYDYFGGLEYVEVVSVPFTNKVREEL